ncbi:MAG: selenocysteine-specific translation elongation factor [Coriobacteriia bacterium]|nr:selenocysteine-specific translation elongation factor [Coriobacteriia bacterium]MCL2749904.1 selenocysteine-specific translation elongation factor [Coriobacteriia bacterium]
MSEKLHLTLGTAGHIDHGKSALVYALTGTDPDRLLEEKRRGITIEIGFAELHLPDETTLSIVDVPGHEHFIKQMISGATGIDLALLCIAADDGIMPQTEEHLAILQLLGVESCIVALTKTDLADEDWLAFVSEEIRQRLAETPFSKAPILATSSKTGAGLPELKGAIAHMASMHRKRSRGAVFRLPVDRAFSIKGSGTVVTGTLWSGSVAAGDEVLILPGNRRARVREVQIHDQPQDVAFAGNRVALNLNAVSVDQVKPGSFLVAPDSIESTDRFDASFHFLDVLGKAKPLESGLQIRVAHGTREVFGRLLMMTHGDGESDSFSKKMSHFPRPHESQDLLPGEKAWVQIRLDEPLAVARNDRFIVRLRSPQILLGGGSILFAHPRRRTVLSKDEAVFLSALESADEAQIIASAVALRTLPFTAPELSRALEIDLNTTSDALASLISQGAVSKLGAAQGVDWYIHAPLLKRFLQKLETLLLTFHSDNPELAGMAKRALMQQFPTALDAGAFDALLNTAEQKGLLIESKGVVSHPNSRSRISGIDEQASNTLLSLLERAQAAPPAVTELIAESKLDTNVARRALASLEAEGKVERVSKDFYYDKQAYNTLVTQVRDFLTARGSASAAELKEVMGVSRKHAIPLLEHFDACRLTKRKEDLRVLATQ